MSFIICWRLVEQTKTAWRGNFSGGKNSYLFITKGSFTADVLRQKNRNAERVFPGEVARRRGVTEKCALICFPLPETAAGDGGMRDGGVINRLIAGPFGIPRGRDSGVRALTQQPHILSDKAKVTLSEVKI